VQLWTVLQSTSHIWPKSSFTHIDPLAQSPSLVHGLVQ
jgi:hypothetical protein